MPQVHSKRYPRHSGQAQLEAISLEWLGQARRGVRVAQVLNLTEDSLELEYIRPGPARPEAASAFGRALAWTHAAGASHFGAPPPTWVGPGWIGLASMTYVDQPGANWGQFYATERVMPYAMAAAKADTISQDGLKAVERLAGRLEAGIFDSPQPGLLSPAAAARLHGDLWSGNVLWTVPDKASHQPWTGAVLIDPSAHGGHAETDLAMLALFGLPCLDTVISAYNEVSALAPGWSERTGLHQIYPLLVHAVLFGGSYGQAALAKARQYL
ncbi:MAG: fructosamine kinase family protein [Bifidobacteriaceae bacterium]|jgi:fructosamine-3-kinase|nr:fructosamine kinase family protein [Bifidobacteriaceae bacterium]